MDQSIIDAIAAEAADNAMPMTLIPDVVRGRVINIDGDYLAYFMAGNDETDIGTARRNAISRIQTYKEMSGAERCVLHLTGSGSHKAWRYLLATVKPYQGQRSGAKPKNWAALRDYLESYTGDLMKVHVWGDREADDGMAWFQWHQLCKGNIELSVSCTRDKDMRQYPGWHINWMTYQMTFVPPDAFAVIGEDELLYGHAWLWQQVLQGDAVDNIPGLESYMKPNGKKGPMGEKTAEAALEGCTSDEEAFQRCAVLYGGTYLGLWGERMAEQLCLLWLRRDPKAEPLNFLRHLKLDHSTDNFKDLLDGSLEVAKRIQRALDEVAALEKKAHA